jgi:hypothetical protein
MKTLKLTLKKKWFDMILSGEKKEEYREVKPYFNSRLSLIPNSYFKNWANESIADYYTKDNDNFAYDYDAIEFTNGYNPKSPKILIEFNFIKVAKGKEEWGAEKDVLYFVLKLGKILKTENLPQS